MDFNGDRLSVIEERTMAGREMTIFDFDQIEVSADSKNALLMVDQDIIKESEGYSLQQYLDEHLAKRTECFKPVSNEYIMRWSPCEIKSPLVQLPQSLRGIGVQIFKNLTGYMGDRPSKKNQDFHVHKHIRLVMHASEDLKDEAYVQVIKQITNNPDQEKTLRGWGFLSIMASTYPPSNDLFFCLLNYCFEIIKQGGDTNLIQKANYVAVRLARTFEQRRKLPPSQEETKFIVSMKPINLPLYFFSGGCTAVLVESYWTMRDVRNYVMRKLQLNISKIPYYAIYEVCDKPDCVEERYIEDNEIICDIMSLWAKEIVEHKKKDIEINFKMFLKIQLYYPFKREDLDTVTMHYIQTCFDFTQGKMRVNEDELLKLSSIQLFVNHGRKSHDEVSEELDKSIKTYVPFNQFSSYAPAVWNRKIMEIFDTLKFNTSLDAKNAYLDILQSNSLWETTQFMCKYSKLSNSSNNDGREGNIDNLPDDCVVGIRPHGVIITDVERINDLLMFPFQNIASWGVNSNLFVIVVKMNEKDWSKYYFESTQTKLFQILMDSYTGILGGKDMMTIDIGTSQTCKMFASMPAGKLKEGQTLRSLQASTYIKSK